MIKINPFWIAFLLLIIFVLSVINYSNHIKIEKYTYDVGLYQKSDIYKDSVISGLQIKIDSLSKSKLSLLDTLKNQPKEVIVKPTRKIQFHIATQIDSHKVDTNFNTIIDTSKKQ